MDQVDKVAYTNSLINQILVKLFLKDVEVELCDGSSKGDNYLGEVKRVIIKKGDKKSSWILKIGLMYNKEEDAFNINKIYTREIMCYEKMFPALDRFQEEFHLKESYKFKHANCLISCTEENLEALVMDDLGQYGYRTIERKEVFDWEMIQIILKGMANFHALSFAMKELKPKEYEWVTSNLNERNLPKHFVDLFNECVKQSKDLISNEKCKKHFNRLHQDTLKAISDFVTYDNSDPYNVIIQGDSWIKNIMLKFSNDKAVDMILVDWQWCKVTSPVFDLSVVLFVNTDCLTRRKYFKQFFDLYYNHLGEKLHLMGCDIRKCYPRPIYEQQIKHFSVYGVIVGVIAGPFIHSDDGLELSELDKEGANFSHNPASIKQLNEVVEDAVHFGFI